MIVNRALIYYGIITKKEIMNGEIAYTVEGKLIKTPYNECSIDRGDYVMLVYNTDKDDVVYIEQLNPRFGAGKKLIDEIDGIAGQEKND